MPRTRSPRDAQFGLRLRAMRVQKKISQDMLGEALGISFQQVQKYETGANSLSLWRAAEVAKHLKTTVNELVGTDGAVPNTIFNERTFKLSLEFQRLYDLSPALVEHFRELIETVCKNLEGTSKKRGRGKTP